MNPVVRTAVAVLGAVVVCSGTQAAPSPGAAGADRYPSKPIRFLVGFPPGGGNDTMARMFGQKISDRFGRPVVIDNRPGAGGNVAADMDLISRMPAEFDAIRRADLAKWTEIVKQTGIRAE